MGIFILCVFMTSCKTKSDTQKDIRYYNTSNEEVTEENSKVQDKDSNQDKVKSNLWPSDLVDFEGAKSECLTPKNGNLDINEKICYSREPFNLICLNPDNQTVYYANYGKDGYIYQLNGSSSKLLVKKKANFLQIWNNELYFMSDKLDEQSLEYGGIYKYNLKTGILKLIIKTEAKWLTVNSNGIYFVRQKSNNGKTFKLDICHIKFGKNIPSKLSGTDGLDFLVYKNIIIKNDYNGLTLYDKLKKKEYTLIVPKDGIEINHMAGLDKGILYYENENNLLCLNLQSGEKKVYDINKLINNSNSIYSGTRSLYNYTLFKNELFISTETNVILRIRQSDDKASVVDFGFAKNGEDTYSMYDLFTSGDRLFAIAQNNNTGKFRMVELIVDSDSVTIKELNK